MEIMDQAASMVEAGGIEAWSKATAESIIGNDAPDYIKSTDILDVWFDSGTTHDHVLRHSHAAQSTGRPTCTSKAMTSTAAGSIPRC